MTSAILAFTCAISGLFATAIIAYGYAHARKKGIFPAHRPFRLYVAETIERTLHFTRSHGHWVLLHSAEHISRAVHVGTHALHAKTRAVIRKSFFPHTEVDNHESLLKALIEKKKAIESDIIKLNEKEK